VTGACHSGRASPTLYPSPACAGLSHLAQHIEEKGIIPARSLDFPAHRCGAGVRAHNVECQPPDDREILRSIVLARTIPILVEDDIENPMQLILDRSRMTTARRHSRRS